MIALLERFSDWVMFFQTTVRILPFSGLATKEKGPLVVRLSELGNFWMSHRGLVGVESYEAMKGYKWWWWDRCERVARWCVKTWSVVSCII